MTFPSDEIPHLRAAREENLKRTSLFPPGEEQPAQLDPKAAAIRADADRFLMQCPTLWKHMETAFTGSLDVLASPIAPVLAMSASEYALWRDGQRSVVFYLKTLASLVAREKAEEEKSNDHSG